MLFFTCFLKFEPRLDLKVKEFNHYSIQVFAQILLTFQQNLLLKCLLQEFNTYLIFSNLPRFCILFEQKLHLEEFKSYLTKAVFTRLSEKDILVKMTRFCVFQDILKI